VVRVRQERLVRDEDGKSKLLLEALNGLSSVLVREVPLKARSARRINPKHCQPPRRERLASLHFRARTVILPRPHYGDQANKALPATLAVNIVHVFEPTPPSGETPIEWLLATSEPVDTVEQVARVVDWYRARWVIEEYFKVLKTGCAYEKRQLESSHALVNALAVTVPVAVELLTLRTDARRTPDADASTILSSSQISVLRVMQRRHKLPQKPTVRDALLAIAALGGHLKNNGDPGWQTLWRGYEKLLLADAAWSAALLTRSDQS
jgi:IS4 transposase